MAFDSLSDKLQSIFKNLRSKGMLTEEDVRTAMKQVRMALLEADVSFKVVKDFVSKVTDRAIGSDVLNGLNPAQTVIKIVNEEMIALMGEENEQVPLQPGQATTVILMAGLQGAGKTTTAAKLAGRLTERGKNPLLVACDVYRPAAIEQLKINGEKVGVPVFEMGTDTPPDEIAKAGLAHAAAEGCNVVLIDTAGRLHVDESMMEELRAVKEATGAHETILVVDAMTGQDAVNVASQFDEQIGISGIILTKLDGDTRGGAALSIRAVTGKPIYFCGMGEKLSDLEPFYPDRMASRILGMGDVLSLIEKAQAELDQEKADALGRRMLKAQFDFNDYLESMSQMKKLGGVSGILSMLPGMNAGQLSQIEGAVSEKQLAHTEAIILSMTPEERSDPKLIDPKRKRRIAAGAGLDISEVNRFLKQFEQTRKMMKQMPGIGGKGKGKKRGGLGGLFGGLF